MEAAFSEVRLFEEIRVLELDLDGLGLDFGKAQVNTHSRAAVPVVRLLTR